MPGKKKSAEDDDARLTKGEIIKEYLAVYNKCMTDDPKSFDAKGALSALDQISRMLGLDTPEGSDPDAGRVILTIADEVGGRGD
ncbi:MAG: hypothetical protein J5449_05595 [Oscillospiraceae bacterium]|nr:hypothetical protein [Oscillospiraceae bacterium]